MRSHRTCTNCGESFFCTIKEGKKAFAKRKFCSKSCCNKYNGRNRAVPIQDRFWSKVSIPNGKVGCWAWVGVTDRNGYGKIHCDGDTSKSMRAHRLSWELHKGPIPSGMVVMHICDNPNCVNPGHLKIGTQKENIQDQINKGRTNPNSLLNLRPGKRGYIGAGPTSRKEIENVIS